MMQSLNYHLLRTALTHYGKSPAHLDQTALHRIENLARREYQVEQRVLTAPESANVCVGDESVAQALALLRARYDSPEQWQDALSSHGLDENEMRGALERELRVEAVLEQVASNAPKASELDIQLFYQLHIDRFQRPETRTARHILLTVNSDYPENAPGRVAERIDEIARRVRSKPHRFAEQAMKHSECPTAMNGGLLGKVPKGQLYPELDQALFAMTQGAVSNVVSTELGLHLIHCETINSGGVIPLHEATARIRERLDDCYRLQCQRAWLASLK